MNHTKIWILLVGFISIFFCFNLIAKNNSRNKPHSSYAQALFKETFKESSSGVKIQELPFEDLNFDGIADKYQENIVTLQSKGTLPTRITIIADSKLFNPESHFDLENSSFYKYPFGQVSFSIKEKTSNITILYHDLENLDGYKYRKVNKTQQWEYFENALIDYITINGKKIARVRLSLKDGGRFDSDGIENGIINDPGGPAILVTPSTSSIPIFNKLSLLIFTTVLFSFLLYRKIYK
jgi:hypothetical protein